MIELYLENFQIFEKVKFSFDSGVTVITGPNSSGKTAIIRAVEALLLNPASAGRWVQHGKKYVRVGLKIGERGWIVWERSKTGVVYREGREEYLKVGRKGAIEVIPNLGFRKDLTGRILNIQSEWDCIFPFSYSPSEMFRFFESVYQIFKSEEVYGKIKEDLQAVKGLLEERIEEGKRVEVELGELEKFVEGVKKGLPGTVEEIEAKISNQKKLEEACLILKQLEEVLKVGGDIFYGNFEWGSLRELKDINSDVVELRRAGNFKKVDLKIGNYDMGIKDTYNRVKEDYDKGKSLKEEKLRMEESLIPLNRRVKDIQEALLQYKECPVCGVTMIKED